jgi:riboflavin kinase/FMN adenylyltransferase
MKKTAAIALGTFDCIHKGHYSVLRGALDFCADIKVVVTFAVPPMRAGAGLVMPESVKERLLTEMGFDEILLLDFPKVRDMSPEEFLQMIFEKYNVVAVSCGFNHRFGHRGLGDSSLLKIKDRRTFSGCFHIIKLLKKYQ